MKNIGIPAALYAPLKKEDVQILWNMGRARVEYADNVHLGGYVCKYITKMGGWSDEALAFIWKNKTRMYGYSRCYIILLFGRKVYSNHRLL